MDAFSEMYARLRSSPTTPHTEQQSEFVVTLPSQPSELNSQLTDMNVSSDATQDNWQSMHKRRSFRQGETLKEGLAKHIEQEGWQLLWDLDQDFIIKDRFETDGTLLESARIIKTSIQHNFNHPIRVLTCAKQRAILLTTSTDNSLLNQCQDVKY